MAKYIEKIGEFSPDNLIASIHTKQHVASGTFASGSGVIKRGTVVSLADGNFSVYAGAGKTPFGILCDDVDATAEDVVAEVYITGHFNRNALIVAGGYELTADDIEKLRLGGIFVENSVTM